MYACVNDIVYNATYTHLCQAGPINLGQSQQRVAMNDFSNLPVGLPSAKRYLINDHMSPHIRGLRIHKFPTIFELYIIEYPTFYTQHFNIYFRFLFFGTSSSSDSSAELGPDSSSS